jgi:hypothetical protein
MFCVWMRGVGEESEGSGQADLHWAHSFFDARRAGQAGQGAG